MRLAILHMAWLTALPAVMSSCADYLGREQPREVFEREDRWEHAPSWAGGSIQQRWWTTYDDQRLNARVATALSNNPRLAVLAARLARAQALTRQAAAASWPSINVGTGLLYGNEAVRMTGFDATDLEPWASSGQVSWEIDLFGKLRAAARSAREAEAAAFWELRGGRLLVASEVAESHFRILRLNGERELIASSVAANRDIVQTLRDRERAGLISTTALRRQEGEHERLSRSIVEIDRLRHLANLELATLLGRSSPEPPPSATFESVDLPGLPYRSTTDVMRSRPDLLAAEAQVRSAFQLEEATRLDLLPSLTLGAGASGESTALASGFREWIASTGPRLEIPIYDPQRLAAVKVRRAGTEEAAALYRQTALKAFQEVESAYLNLVNRRRQLALADREVDALSEARRNTLATLKAGLVSQVELLESERRTLEARRQRLALRHALLRDHLALVRALGGGL